MNYLTLRDELLAGHPVTGAYSLDDEVAASQLNTVNRQVNRESMTGDEVYNTADPDEWLGLNVDKKNLWASLCSRQDIDPFARVNVRTAIHIFGTTSQTLIDLAAARKRDVSRAEELGLGFVRPGDVSHARSL